MKRRENTTVLGGLLFLRTLTTLIMFSTLLGHLLLSQQNWNTSTTDEEEVFHTHAVTEVFHGEVSLRDGKVYKIRLLIDTVGNQDEIYRVMHILQSETVLLFADYKEEELRSRRDLLDFMEILKLRLGRKFHHQLVDANINELYITQWHPHSQLD